MKYKAEPERKRTSITLLSLITAAGIIAGAFYSVKGQYTDYPQLHQFFMPYGTGVKMIEAFTCSSIMSLIFLAAVFSAGTSIFGQPLSVLLLMYRGFGAGLAVSGLYNDLGFKAVAVILPLVFPKAVLYLTAAVLAVRESVYFSCGLARYAIFGEGAHGGRLRLYIIRFIVLAFLSVLVSAGDAALNHF